jgi:glycine hydroxymethyltransferase
LRGARGGMILWNNDEYTKKINGSVFPGTQGGPLMNQVAGKVQSYSEALKPEFGTYSKNVVEMSQYMCSILKEEGIKLTTGGTDSHIILIHTGHKSGAEVADTLESEYNIVVNKNSIPNDHRGVWETSGIRIGTAAMVTKKGNNKEYFKDISSKIINTIK